MEYPGYAAMLDAIGGFFRAIADDPHDVPTDVAAVGRALDRLSLAYADSTGDVEVTDAAGPEPGTANDARQRMAARFSFLGFYAVADPELPPGETMVGDAIDDLCDIERELLTVRWHADRGRWADAAFAFRFGYESHWGQHLHELRRYLYFLQFGH